MQTPMVFLGLVLLATCGLAGEVLVLDDFEYRDEAAAQQAWQMAENSDPVELMQHESEGGKTALRMPCSFTREDVNRAVYDREVQLDLRRHGTIEFDFYADDTTPIRNGTIYFRSGDGWYGAGFQPAEGWKHIVLGKGAFGIEDQPAGWGAISGIRICAWKSQARPTFCAVDNLRARAEDIAIIRGTAEGGENRTARDVAARIGEALRDMGVPHGTLTDGDVIDGALEGRKLAIFGYSPAMGDELADRIGTFIAAGGKVVVCYTIHERVRELLGIDGFEYTQREYDGQFADVAFEPNALPGLPEKMNQNSWNANIVTPGEHNARAVGSWQDAEGKQVGTAVLVSDNGAYMGHILTGGDLESKKMFLVSLVGHFVPEAWGDAATHALEGATRIGPFAQREDLEEYLNAEGPKSARGDEIGAMVKAAEQAQEEARAALAGKQYVAVMTSAAAMREALADAYILAHSPRDGEFRAVWNHSGTGDCGTWEEAMQRLSDANFNAVVPNMWWAGVAHYDSALLPHSKTFDEQGDQIAQCVEAGKRHGIEVHPWKVNWNLSNAPADFVEKLRAEGRLQADPRGEELKWLCPSHPDNFQLELDTMLEVARDYDVDGVHFDYIRYPHGNSCYCDGCRQRFEESRGEKVANWPEDCYSGELKPEYRQWRCDNITRLVRATAEEARKIKPHIKISAAVFGSYPGTKDSIGQDWVLWCRDGWLDFVCPMDYTQSDSYFHNLAQLQVGYVGGVVPLYTGIGHFRIPDDQAIGQMQIARSHGADGFILFNMGTTLAERGFPKFGKAITSEKALLPHNSPIIRFQTDLDSEEPLVTTDAERLSVKVTLVGLGAHRKRAMDAIGEIELQDLDGNRLEKVGDLPEIGQTETLEIARRDGAFRLAAVGEMKFDDNSTRPFIRRSRPYRFGEGE